LEDKQQRRGVLLEEDVGGHLLRGEERPNEGKCVLGCLGHPVASWLELRGDPGAGRLFEDATEEEQSCQLWRARPRSRVKWYARQKCDRTLAGLRTATDEALSENSCDLALIRRYSRTACWHAGRCASRSATGL
jgi:hypothetical protein